MADTRFKRGARPTPRHKLLATIPHVPHAAPVQWPPTLASFLEMWLNDQDGDCVTAEEAAAVAQYSVVNGLPESKITDATVLAFCNKFGFLDGANLTDVMDKMISDGFIQDGGYKDGPYAGVDYSNETVLQSAIAVGPVKIGIDADALPSGAGNGQGWFAFGGSPGQFSNEDHCVGLWGYGPIAYLVQLIQSTFGVTLAPPANAPASGYIIYTWSTVGIVDHAWIMSTCGEAWVRNPTTVGVSPAPNPLPPPPPPPGPTTLYSLTTNPDGSMLFAPVTSTTGNITVTPQTTLAEIVAVLDGVGKKMAFPPFILNILKFICPFAALVPPPFGTFLVTVCAMIPQGVKLADGSVQIVLTDSMSKTFDVILKSPHSTGLPAPVVQFEDWLRGQSAAPCRCA